jgi:hypothetical protein
MALPLLVTLLLAGCSQPDFEAGLEAYQNKDYPRAAQIWRGLAEDGDDRAQYYLGNMHRAGLGMERDFATAAEWFRRAATQGNAEAQYNLAWLYQQGKGVAESPALAYRWYALADKWLGPSAHRRQAREAMEALEGRLSAEQIATAREWVQDWSPGASARGGTR